MVSLFSPSIYIQPSTDRFLATHLGLFVVLLCASDGDCPAGSTCTNNAFQRKRWAALEFAPAGRKGYGLFAQQDIAAGQLVIEYCGEVMDEKTFRARKAAYVANGLRHSYFMALNSTEYIDACEKGNMARFTNHR